MMDSHCDLFADAIRARLRPATQFTRAAVSVVRAKLGNDTDRGDPLGPWLQAESTRVREHHDPWWDAAGRLLDDLDLGPEGMASERAAAEADASRARPRP